MLAAIVFLAVADAGSAHESRDVQLAAASEAIARMPRNAELYLKRGNLHRMESHWDDALADYARAAGFDSGLPELGLLRAKALRGKGLVAAAAAELDRFLKDNPAHAEARLTRARVRRDQALYLAAVSDYAAALRHIATPSPDLYLECAASLERAGPEYRTQALAILDAGLRKLGTLAVLENAAIDLEIRLGRFAAALQRVDILLGQPGRKDPWLARKAELLMQAGRAREALACYRAAAEAIAALPGDRQQSAAVRRLSQQAAAAGAIHSTPDQTVQTGLTVVRGPYLQQLSATGVVVRWRTDVPTNSLVIYGASDGGAILTNIITGPRTEHSVPLAGLTASTRYDYSVGMSSGVLAGGTPDYHFTTAPVIGTPGAVRIWVLGDSGTANGNAAAVRDAFLAWAGSRPPDMMLMLGDNAYTSGTDAEYQPAVFDMYPDTLRNTVLWPTLGNHDGGSADSVAQTGVYYDIFTLPRSGECGGLASGTEAYYSYDFANMHLVCLNSYDIDRSTNGAMLTWLKLDLAATAQKWVIAFWHHPPYSKGSHDSDTETELVEMRQNALPILEAAGVDLVLCGHSHAYERSKFMRGHFGLSSSFAPSMVTVPGGGRADVDGVYDKGRTNGAVYAVAGSSGQTSGGSLNHPAMFVSLNELGSMALDVSTNRLEAHFIVPGLGERDHFTLVKGEATWQLTTAGGDHGGVAPQQGRFLPDRPVLVQATASNYFQFAHWTGAVVAATNPLVLAVVTDMQVTAVFDAVCVTNRVPQWWLAKARLGTNDAAALSNADHDAMATWQEYFADTDPTNPASFFAVRAVTNAQDTALFFAASTQRLYSLEAMDGALTGTWRSVEGQQHVPGAGPVMSLVDTNPGPALRAFRVRVELP